MASKVVGLTGGIGSGKSSIATQFSALGITVIDTDQIARDVVEPGTTALQAIVEHFGKQVESADGSLDRTALRQIVFQQQDEKEWLEQLLHPLIRQQLIAELAASTSPYTLLMSPLLLETDQQQLCQFVIVVDVPENVQIERASRRDDNSRQQIERIIASQMPRQQRLQHADAVIDNSASLQQSQQQVQQLHRQLLEWANE